MESNPWQERLRPYGIQVKQVIPLRDWSESRVLRIEGKQQGEPVVYFLKWSRRGMAHESAIYRFAARHSDFPAAKAVSLMVSGEEWLLLNRVDGNLLADIAKTEFPGVYVTAARGMARFHAQASAAGWATQLSCLEVLIERLEVLPSIAINDLWRKIEKSEYSGVEPSLLSQVEEASTKCWPAFLETFRNYPNSLIHGDCHYGNLFLTPTDEIRLIDWASAANAPGLMDLTALVDVTRRMRATIDPEQDILAAYFGELPHSEQEAYGNPERAWAVCRAVRAFMELEWFATTGEDYGQRAQRELALLYALLRS